MTFKQIIPWRWGGLSSWESEERPFESFLQGIDVLQKEMDQLFEGFWKDHGRRTSLSAPWDQFQLNPRLDETEDDKAFHIKVELPGMDKDDVDITLANGQLTIRGEKKREEEEKGKDYYRNERTFGAFRRSLPIPVDVDESKIQASFKKGVLSIKLPKSEEARNKIKHIDVKAA